MSWQSLAFAIVLAMALVSLGGAQQSLPAQKILSQIAAGQPVHYDGIAITGDLDLSTLPGAQIPAAFALFNCTIPDASFEGITFAEDAFFWGSSLQCSIEMATFQAGRTLPYLFPSGQFAGCPSTTGALRWSLFEMIEL